MIEITTKNRLQKNSKWLISLNKNIAVNVISFFVICFGAVRNGHDDFRLSILSLMMVSILIVCIGRGKICREIKGKELLPFLIIGLLEIPIQTFNGDYYIVKNAFGGVILYGLMILTLNLLVDGRTSNYLWNVINFISLFAAIIIIIQVLTTTIGIRLDKIAGISDALFKAWEFNNGAFFRPCSIFSEPSHFAEIALLSLYYYMFVDFSKIKIFILGVASIISTSSLGIIGVILLVAMYVVNLNKIRSIKRWKRSLLIFLICFVSLFTMIWVGNTTNFVVNRIMSGGSASVRIFRSFELYDIMKVEEKIWGIGIQNQELYLNTNNILLPSDNYETMYSNREFSQTFGYILCTTGALGLLALVIPLVILFLKSNYKVKVLCGLFLFVCLTCCIFSRATFLIYLILIYATIDMLNTNQK